MPRAEAGIPHNFVKALLIVIAASCGSVWHCSPGSSLPRLEWTNCCLLPAASTQSQAEVPLCPAPSTGRQRHIPEEQLSCPHLQTLEFNNNSSSEGITPASLIGGWSWPSWELSQIPGTTHLCQQPWVLPLPPFLPGERLCHCCYLWESKNIQKQLSEVRHWNAYLSTWAPSSREGE